MKIRIKISLLAVLFAFTFMACDNKEFLYNEENAFIRIEGENRWTVGTDSIVFSFAIYPSTTSEETLNITASVIGVTQDRDRELKLIVDDSQTTAVEGEHYEFTSLHTVPAGESSTNIPVIIKRTPELETGSVSLFMRVEDTDDFKAGVNEWDHIKIIWSDKIERPSNWEDLTEFFGEYSDAKYRFIIETTDLAEFPYPDQLNWSEMNNFKLIMQEALLNYNDANPGNELRDENGNLVIFPL